MTMAKTMPSLRLLLIFGLWSAALSWPADAHHVLGRPSYGLNEDSNTPPSIQVETQAGAYFLNYTAFPAFPRPEEPGRIHLYVSRIDNGEPFQSRVTFEVRENSWFSSAVDVLGVQDPDDNVFRQGFLFHNTGDYIVTAQFEADGQAYSVDFPLRIGEPWPLRPVTLAIGAAVIGLVGLSLLQRKRLLRAKIRAAREDAGR
jgi:hypothetical protein